MRAAASAPQSGSACARSTAVACDWMSAASWPRSSEASGAEDVRADLFDLCRGRQAGRAHSDEITLFKSVGTAIEDLAAAILVWRSLPL